jgi:DNA-directed RNA polymerase subunit M/transcription elongation factor TFIIS
MKFCSFCDNMQYIRLAKDDSILYYCKNCGAEDAVEDKATRLVLERSFMDDSTSYKQYMNEYLKYDPTLPRVTNIKCPSTTCKDQKDKEVIVVRYDNTNMKYLYHCSVCSTFWRTSDKEENTDNAEVAQVQTNA